MAKTYVPTLRVVLRQAYNYSVHWQPKLALHLTSEQATCLASLIQALSDCLILLGDTPINP
jgi:hypothetical protein